MKKLILLFVVLFLVINCIAQDLPKTPAGKRAKQIVELINSGDKEKAEDYISKNFAPSFLNAFPMSQHVGVFTMTKQSFGELVLEKVISSTDHQIRILLRSTSADRWLSIMIEVESSEPYKISRMGIRPSKPPSGSFSETKNTSFSTFKEMDAYLIKQTEKNEFSGVVLVAKDGKSIFKKAYGFASKNYNVPNRIDTKFNLGSLNKMFTSLAITQLAEKGELDFNDNIGKHLKGFPKEAAEKVTIRHLLQMRSGWGDYWDNETYLARRSDLRTVSDYIEFLKNLPLQFEPGTQMIHSNTSFQVLGAIIEVVSGQDYFEYVQEHIFKPSGMSNSDPMGARDAPVENVATGYTNMNPHDPDKTGYRWSNIYMIAVTGTPAGGGYATADDLLAFDVATRSNRLMNTKYTNFFYNRFQGTVDSASRPSRIMTLAGGAPGVNTYFVIDLKDGYTIIVLSNYDMPVAGILSRAIIKMLGL